MPEIPASYSVRHLVDKIEFISYTNNVFDTEQQYLCVSRPRRFGKSMAANMLSAYYDRTVDAAPLFRGLKIENVKNFHSSRYDVIVVNMQEFLSRSHDVDAMLKNLHSNVVIVDEWDFGIYCVKKWDIVGERLQAGLCWAFCLAIVHL